MNSNKRLSPNDPGSYSLPERVAVSHINLELEVDFTNEKLKGFVDLSINKIDEQCNQIILDILDLNVVSIINRDNGSALEYTIGDRLDVFGSKLEVQIPLCKTSTIRIAYETSKTATALQWLLPEQTLGKKYPYLFSQNQPSHARSMLPCQDTPSIKSTYSAKITVPKPLTALMSAVSIDIIDCGDSRKFLFEQTVPVQSYLIAIAVGNLVSKTISPMSKVWSEPEEIDKAVYEFEEIPELLKCAEKVCGPYVWKIYDVLVMPPSFPFGGMENPCLTFVTPTLLAGDRSLVDVIAHEIAHSWTGNLVTNCNFEHFWLNEGFTVYVERRINGLLYGESSREFAALGGLEDLRQAVIDLGAQNPLTKLVVDLSGIDPDDAFSTCPYEKGHTFLFYLEKLFGAEKFYLFFKSYVDKFKYKSISTEDFKSYLLSYFRTNNKTLQIDWDLWLYTLGMPPIIPPYDSSYQDVCEKLLDRWIKWDGSDEPFNESDISCFQTSQKIQFLALLLKNNITLIKIKAMQKAYNFNNNRNCEILLRWFRSCLKVKWLDPLELIFKFINNTGRMKYVRPIYRDLYNWDEVRQKAIENFEKNKQCMMYVCQYTVSKDLHLRD
ncbi:leukotriene A-4 hydrolase [Daktulosphaira vitifoliae]|uniref:leukotriene A-4 hydrolase n=1 Tax=Daktulosphaira vitifoliae TaxID=58002 RepID=UPI0021AA7F5E|nr:leukotriene A-4 hydrolase [Daktulosphaira vitifoliae]XP_050524901.1 leukotriene A-4 hydrolase [Daktulosphaira vitifoliae]XP_050524910.1 leukotriene A-4 hydrolase [Daktulosphaira vitifoliae]